jgi:hypothetical protein
MMVVASRAPSRCGGSLGPAPDDGGGVRMAVTSHAVWNRGGRSMVAYQSGQEVLMPLFIGERRGTRAGWWPWSSHSDQRARPAQ